MFAAKRSQVPLAGLFVIAALAFLLVHRVTRQQSNAGWVTTDVQRATNALLRTGAVLAVVATGVVAIAPADAVEVLARGGEVGLEVEKGLRWGSCADALNALLDIDPGAARADRASRDDLALRVGRGNHRRDRGRSRDDSDPRRYPRSPDRF